MSSLIGSVPNEVSAAVMGEFAGSGSYATSPNGNRELGFEEDLFAALRLGSHFQVGLLAPFLQTSRQQGTATTRSVRPGARLGGLSYTLRDARAGSPRSLNIVARARREGGARLSCGGWN